MANVNKPNGFSPVGTLSGASWNQQGRMYAVANDAANTYAIGDVVMSAASASVLGVPLVTKWTGACAASGLPLGIIVGVQVADPTVSLVGTSISLEKTYLLQSAGVHYVYVVDDPLIIFEAQFDVTGATLAQLHMNSSCTITAADGLTPSAPYASTVLTSPATTASLPIRLLGAVQRQVNEVTTAASPYIRALCKWNFHEYGVQPQASNGAAGTSYLAQ